jgi:hypothetical protein
MRNHTYVRRYDPGSPLSDTRTVSITKITKNITSLSSVMTDSIVARPEVFVDPKTLKWRRIRYPSSKYQFDITGAARLFGKNRAFRPIQPCSHTKTRIDLKDANREFVVVLGSHVNNWTNEFTRTYSNPYLAITDLTGDTADPATLYNSAPQAYSAGDYKKIDWYALTDSFTEQCESFTKSKFLAGETMYESAIFADAFKVLLNPTRALPTLVKNILQRSSSSQLKKFRRMKLGEFARSCKGLTKSAVNAHLSYDFAIKPAIEDVKHALDAHSFVSARMRYLRQHSGSFVPIRVRQELPANFDNTTTTPPTPGQNSKLFVNLEYKYTVGTISAWARIREDLDWEDSWSAYLQYFGIGKMVGLLWELVPFSFVVDWVSNAQEHINHVSRLRTGGPFCGIRSLCASEKSITRKNLMFHPGYNASLQCQITNPVGPNLIGHCDQINYYRYASIPTTSGLVDFSNLGSFQYVKFAELVFQIMTK